MCRYFFFFLIGVDDWSTTFRFDLGGTLHFGAWAAKNPESEFVGEDHGGIWIHTNLTDHLPFNPRPGLWHHFCMSINTMTGRVVILEKGQVGVDKISEVFHGNSSVAFNQNSSNICVLSNRKYKGSMLGKVSDLQVSSPELTSHQMVAFTQCQNSTPGNIVSWQTAEWQSKGLVTTEEQLEEMCNPPVEQVVIPRASQTTAVRTCAAMGGRVSPNVSTDNGDIEDLLKSIPGCNERGTIWVGLLYDGSPGRF